MTTPPRKKLRYTLNWANSNGPKPSCVWAIYDWKPPICQIAYFESRAIGRKVCALLNAEEAPHD